MGKTKDWLKGKKSYIVAIAVGIVAFLRSLGYDIPEGTLETLGALALVFVRAGIKKGGESK